jgi:hypothetical protein
VNEAFFIPISFLSLAFGLWAGVVAWGVRRITNQLETIGTDLKEESRRLRNRRKLNE